MNVENRATTARPAAATRPVACTRCIGLTAVEEIASEHDAACRGGAPLNSTHDPLAPHVSRQSGRHSLPVGFNEAAQAVTPTLLNL